MRKLLIMTALGCLLVQAASADEFDGLVTYTHGKDRSAEQAFNKVYTAKGDEKAAIEDKLIAVISNDKATADGKQWACRMLQIIGTEKAVPALSGLLKDDVLSTYARLVLERMTGSEAAIDALRGGMKKAEAKALAGIVASLGELRDEGSVKQIAKLAKNKDADVAAAATMALGKIGNKDAAKALNNLKPAEGLEQAYMDGIIACADNVGGSTAMGLYEKAIADGAATHQSAALMGIAKVDQSKGADHIAAALGGADYGMRMTALTAVVVSDGDKITKVAAGMIDNLEGAWKARLITALGARGDKAALSKIMDNTGSEDESIRDAAIMAASKLGDAKTAKALLAMSSKTAIKAIALMPGADVNDGLIAAMSDSSTRMLAVECLIARNCKAAVPKFLDMVNDKDADVRKTAWSGLGSLGSSDQVDAIVKAAVKIKDDKELSYARSAIKKIFASASDKKKCFDAIAGHYVDSNDSLKTTVIEIAAIAGNDRALELVNKALTSTNDDLYGSAIRSLAAWSNPSASEGLLKLAKEAKGDTNKLLALRGYITMAGSREMKLSGEQRTEMLKKADSLVNRVEEKKMIISSVVVARHKEVLPLLLKYSKEAELKNDVENAAANLLWDMRREKTDDGVKLLEIIKQSTNKHVMNRVKAITKEWEKQK